MPRKGHPGRLFALVYAIGTVVTTFLSNDAAAVVLTPAVFAAAQKAKAAPLPLLFICAFIANAASLRPADLEPGQPRPVRRSCPAAWGLAGELRAAVAGRDRCDLRRPLAGRRPEPRRHLRSRGRAARTVGRRQDRARRHRPDRDRPDDGVGARRGPRPADIRHGRPDHGRGAVAEQGRAVAAAQGDIVVGAAARRRAIRPGRGGQRHRARRRISRGCSGRGPRRRSRRPEPSPAAGWRSCRT